MKKKILFLCAMLLPNLLCATLTVEYLDGSEEALSLAAIRRMEFSFDEKPTVQFANLDGSAKTACGVATIVFAHRQTTALPTAEGAQVRIFPNPTTETLIVENATSEAFVYDLSGVCVRRQKLNDGQNSIFVGDLDNGVYLLSVDETVVKVIKK